MERSWLGRQGESSQAADNVEQKHQHRHTHTCARLSQPRHTRGTLFECIRQAHSDSLWAPSLKRALEFPSWLSGNEQYP